MTGGSVSVPDCAGCAERDAEIVELRHRLRVAVTDAADGDLYRANNPAGIGSVTDFRQGAPN